MSNLAVQNDLSSSEESQNSQSAGHSAPIDTKNVKKAQGAFKTISEVADELDVPQHVLRFWETKFSQVKPLKRGGGRRYYRPEDVALLKHIHHQLYTEGYTIKGVQKLLKGQGKNQIAAQVIAAEEAPVQQQPKVPAVEQQRAAEVQAEPRAQVEGRIGQPEAPVISTSAKIYNLSDRQRSALEDMLEELRSLRAMFPQEVA